MGDMQCNKFSAGDWSEWVQMYDAYAILREWTAEKKLTALPLYLDGPALQVFRSLTDAQRVDWEITCASLKLIFVREDDDAEARFIARRQQPDETIAMFAAGLRFLGGIAFAEHSAVTREKLLLRKFLLGIDSQVAEETARQNPANLDTAVLNAQTALKIRRSLLDIQRTKIEAGSKDVAKDATSCLALTGQNGEMNQLRKMIEQLTLTVESLSERTKHLQSGNERSRDYGVHWRSPTPPRANRQETRWTRRQSPGRNRDERNDSNQNEQYTRQRCYACNQRGHVRRDCRNTRGYHSGN